MELTKTDIHNLLIFLKRTTMQGTEVPVYNQLTPQLETLLTTPEDVPKEGKEVQEERS